MAGWQEEYERVCQCVHLRSGGVLKCGSLSLLRAMRAVPTIEAFLYLRVEGTHSHGYGGGGRRIGIAVTDIIEDYLSSIHGSTALPSILETMEEYMYLYLVSH